MTFKGITSMEAKLWTKIVEHENKAKRDWEAITGDHSKAKFYQGRYKDEYLKTLDACGQSSATKTPQLLPKSWEPTINVFETVLHKTPLRHRQLSPDDNSLEPVNSVKLKNSLTMSADRQMINKLKQLQTISNDESTGD